PRLAGAARAPVPLSDPFLPHGCWPPVLWCGPFVRRRFRPPSATLFPYTTLFRSIFLLLAPAIAGASLATLASVFIAIWLIAEGIGTATLAWQERKVEDSKWGWPFVGGIAGVIAGVAIFVFPLSFARAGGLLVRWVVAISVIISGIGLIRNRPFISVGLWLGIINIAFGVLLAILLVANPTSTMISMVWVMGIFGVAYGIQAIIMGFKVRPKKTA